MKDTRHLILFFFNGKNIEFVFGHNESGAGV